MFEEKKVISSSEVIHIIEQQKQSYSTITMSEIFRDPVHYAGYTFLEPKIKIIST